MQYVINDLEPSALFHYFEEISAIPRPSLGEDKIADYLEAFAKARGLWCYRDGANNVLIRKPASKGRENAPTLLLQAHTDMVCEKRPEVVHDFNTEGLTLCRKGDLLFAEGTTLGADDGFGVAIMLALLADSALSHPPLECLFTSAEEIGLVGAGRFDYRLLLARYMLNLDSAEENTVIVGCCGGIRSKISLPVFPSSVEGAALTVTVGGLCGGHSGEDVHRGRLNANVEMGRLLQKLADTTKIRLAHLSGGDKSNAIPRDCTATVWVEDAAAAEAFAADAQAYFSAGIMAKEDENAFVRVERCEIHTALSFEDTAKVLRVLSLPNGVLSWRTDPPIMPHYSRNLASVRTSGECIVFELSSRSPDASLLELSCREQSGLAASIGATVSYSGSYPGWESATDAPLVKMWQQAYASAFGLEVTPTLIHAGLETGLITNAVKGLEAISVGCHIHDLHTPVETMELDSFARIYQTIVEFLRIIS
ncbi:MAG: aminoacyl-histidine dipeptidase [Ruminococcaceae bacterium]|nr:aminoacyl-histidine dipeptidase [Oscillospiraceae bacterium]